MTISRNLSALAQYIASGGILGQAASLPTQTSNSGKFLTTDGTTASWGTVSALPSQTGNSGKFLTTDGSTASWNTAGGTVASGAIYLNNRTITSSYTIATGQGALSVGPVTLASGATLTVSSGSRYVVL
jgi:hypothetical protein